MVQTIQTEFEDFFTSIETAVASSQILGQDIPLLGDDLANIAPKPPTVFQDIQTAIDKVLAPLPTDASATQIAAALNGAGVAGLMASVSGANADQVAITLQAKDPVPLQDAGVALDTGVPAIGLDATANLSGALTPTLNVALNYDTAGQALTLADAGTDDLDIGLAVGVDASADAKLGPLGVSIATPPTTPTAPAKPQLSLDFAVDLAAGADGAVTAAKIAATGGVDLELALKTDPILGANAQGMSLLPTIATDLSVKYTLGSTPTVALNDITVDLGSLIDQLAQTLAPVIDIFNETPFKQILKGLLGPIPIINDAAHLIPPLLKFLDTVPDGGDKLISALDLAGDYYELQDPSKLPALQEFASALAVIQQVTNLLNAGGAGGLGTIDLGSITLMGDTSADPTATTGAAAPAGGTAANAAAATPTVTAVFASAGDAVAAANAAVDQSMLFDGPVAYPGADGDEPTALSTGLLGTDGAPGLSIPLLQDPNGSEIEQILLPELFPSATPVTLISYSLPELTFDVNVPPGPLNSTLFLPIVGPFGLTLGGSFGATLGFEVGYNTAGLTTGNPADGLFLAALPGQSDIASITAGVKAGVGVDLEVVQAIIEGGIKATVGAGLTQPEVPLLDFTSYVTPDGKLDAVVDVTLTVGFGPFSFTLSDNVVDVTIIDFSAGEAAGTIDQQAGLASYVSGPGPGGNIVLNAGYRAPTYRNVDPYDDDENFTIGNSAVDAQGKPTTDTLDVSALGVDELFGAPGQPVTAIVESDLGKGNNTLTVAPDVTQSVNLTAGDGNNTFTAGAGMSVIRAGNGVNTFYGGSGNDSFATGAGANFFHPGSGPVSIDGDANGHNQVTYDKSTAGVTIAPIAGQQGLFGTGGDAQGDYLSNVQDIVGSAHDDHLTAQQDIGTTLDGGGGEDVLLGGDGDDFLIGGAGADYIDGAGGENGTSYITSRAGVTVDLATGFADRGDATGDTLLNIQDLQGSDGDDVLTGTPGVNRIDGQGGDDIIDGDGGADYLEGGDGDDTIFASGDGDMLDGGFGSNTLSYARYAPGLGGAGVTVDLATGQGGGADQIGTIATDGSGGFSGQVGTYSTFQTLVGSTGNDTLQGDSNDDLIEGGDGDDTLVVGAGDATLIGGAGADTLIGGTATDGSNDGLVGGGGIATADYSDGDGVTVDLAAGTGLRSTAEGDQLYDVANLVGSPGADVLTGDAGDNVIDPGLSRGIGPGDVNGGIDMVDGGGGTDTLKLDFSNGDDGGGLTGGFGTVSNQGTFRRLDEAGTIDGVDFSRISKIDVDGTNEGDTIYGGLGGDTIRSEGGNDTIYEQGGPAVVEAGDGDDTVFYGTDASHNLLQQGNSSATSGPFYLDGGAGIDTLSISFANDTSARDSDIALSGQDPGTAFYGTNLTLPDGSAITDFEIVKDVVTENGNDTVRQPGDVDNTISTGFGQDLIAPGLGADTIDGGYDFTIGKEISGPQTDSDTKGTYYNVLDQTAFLQNGGDELDLDYSTYTGAGGVTGTTNEVESTIDARLNGYSIPVVTNDGTYTAGPNSDSFSEIERLNVIGSSQNDVLVGTVDGFATLPQSDNYDSLASKRGDDVLEGGAGDDVLIGLSGSDVLDGGAGNDLLIGGENDTASQRREQEIDTLTGGSGADRFVLGTADGTFYDSVQNFSGVPVVTTTRAVITDFTPADGDTIELYDKASDYVTVQSGADTLIYDTNNNTNGQYYGLVAQVQNFTGFDLNASYVSYDSPAAAFASPVGTDGNPVSAATTDLRNAESGVAIAPEPAAHTSSASVAHPETASLDSKASPAVAPPAAAFTVTQDSNPQDLETALVPGAAAAGIDPSSQSITLSGNAAAFGTFSNDPFGLGSGIVLSTGKVTDIVGPNTFSEPTSTLVSEPLTFVNIGSVRTDITVKDAFGNPVTYAGGLDNVYRVDLSRLGTNLASLLLKDGNTVATDLGGGGVSSGLDIDGIVLSHTAFDASDLLTTLDDGTTSPKTADSTLNNPSFLKSLDPDPLDFSAADLVFTPGTQKPSDPGFSQGPDLQGSINGLVNNSLATLQTFDGGNYTGALSLGDGGSLGLNLTQSVATTDPLYLYVATVADSGPVTGDSVGLEGTASNQPIPGSASSATAASGPLSTDFGTPGPEGDTTSLTYTFKTEPGAAVDSASFTFALFTQDLPLLAGSGSGDQFKITLNGVNLALLSDGSAATIDDLESSPYGVASSDLVLNTAADAPAHDITAVNAYTTPLTFVGALNPAGQTNTLVIQVADVDDGLLDSGILIKQGTFKAGAGPGGVTIVDPGSALTVGGPPATVQVTVDPGPVAPTAPVTIVLTPADGTLDLGNGAGKPATITIAPGGPYTVDLPISAADTGIPESGITSVASVAVTSADPRFDGTPVAPVVVDIASDALPPAAYHWTTNVGGDFSDASKWTPTGVPAAADDAYVDATDRYELPYTVTVSAPEAVDELTTVAQATVAIADGGAQSVGALTVGGSILNAGAIALDGGGDPTTLSLGSAYDRNITLSGGGRIILSDSAKNLIGTSAASAGTTLDNIDNTIFGSGEISGDNGFSLINESVNTGNGSIEGSIEATGVDNGLLIDDVLITNHGYLVGAGAGGLQLTADTIVNTDGVIDADGVGAHVDLDDTSIRGGTLLSDSGGVFNVDSNLELDGDAGDTVTLAADLQGVGTLDLEDGTARISGGTVLPLGGLSISDGATAEIPDRLADGTPVVNDGTIAVDAGASFTLGGPLSGSGGKFDVEGSATLDLDGTVGPSQSVVFSGDGGNLVLEVPEAFTGSISGFTPDDTLDLRGETVEYVNYDSSASTLSVTLSNATTQTFDFTSDASTFFMRGDGLGGSIIYAAASATTAPPAAATYDASLVSTAGSGPGNGYANLGQTLNDDGVLDTFESNSTNLGYALPGPPFIQIFTKNLESGAVSLASETAGGTIADYGAQGPAISADGSHVAFVTVSDNLGAGNPNGVAQVDVRDLVHGTIQDASTTSNGTISVAAGNNGAGAGEPSLSGDGSKVAFESASPTFGAPGTTDQYGNLLTQIYVKDLTTGSLTLVSAPGLDRTTNGNGLSEHPSISGDGNLVVFDSRATNLVGYYVGPTPGNESQVYLKDISTGQVTLLSGTEAPDGTVSVGNASSLDATISTDGSSVVFVSTASNLVDGVPSGSEEVYERNLASGTLALVSANSDGTAGNGVSQVASVSSNGRYVEFQSNASNLPGADGNQNVYVKDMATGTLSLVQADADATDQRGVSSDGSVVTYYDPSSEQVYAATATQPYTIALDPVDTSDLQQPVPYGDVTIGGTTTGIAAGSAVTLTIGQETIGTATVGNDGTFSTGVTAFQTLPGGTYTVTASVAGKTSTSQQVTADAAPTVLIAQTAGGLLYDADDVANGHSITLSGQAVGVDGQTLTVSLPTAAGAETLATTTVENGAWSLQLPAATVASGIPDGSSTLQVSVPDSDGLVVSDFESIGKDTAPPVVTAPAVVPVTATSAAGAVVNFTATATDTIDGTDPVVFSTAPGSVFAIGTTMVTATATDKAGNVGQTTIAVTVADATAPTVRVPTPVSVLATSSAGAVVNFEATATDPVDGTDPTSLSQASGSMFAVGTTLVKATAVDKAGNTGSASFAVTVVDPSTGTPTANAQTDAVAFNTAQAITLTGSDPDVPPLPLTYSVTSNPTHGTLSGSGADLTYTPADGFQGTDSFSFTDSNGQNTSSSATVTLDVAPAAPLLALAKDTGVSATDGITGDPTIVATPSSPGDMLLFKADAAQTYSATAPTFATDGSADGVHTVSVKEEDKAGGVSGAASLTFTLDTTAPAAPSTPADAFVMNGYVDAANDTPAQTISGTAEASSTVKVYDGATLIDTTAANGSGSWSYQVGTLADGTSHSYTATATDAAGNTGPASNALAFAVDTTAPAAPSTPKLADDNGASVTDTITTDPAITYATPAPGDLLLYSTDGTTYSTLAPSFTTDGQYMVSTEEQDAAGNVSAPSATLAFTLAPTSPGLTQALNVDQQAAATPLFATTPTVSDVNPNATVTATLNLAASLGTLQGAGTANNGVYTFSGPAAAVTSELDAVTFTPTPGFNGSGSVAVALSDGAVQGDAGSVLITVNPVISGDVPSGTYVIGDIYTYIAPGPNGPNETELSSVSNTVAPGVGTLQLAQGSAATAAVAVQGNHTLIGNQNDNVFVAQNGVDKLIGGSGNNIYNVDDARDPIIQAANGTNDIEYTSVSNAVAPNVGTMQLVEGSAAVSAVAVQGNHTLIGNQNDNVFVAQNGVDTLIGGSGNNIYNVDDARDPIIQAANGTNDVEYSSVSNAVAPNVRTLQLVEGSAATGIVAVSGNHTLIGNDNGDVFVAQNGTDFMYGGSGNDIYNVDSNQDQIIEQPNGGYDTVYSTVSFHLSANVEALHLVEGSGATVALGNGGDTSLYANSNGDVLNGLGGNDFIYGGAGADTFQFSQSNFGNQTVENFDPAHDSLSFANFIYSNYTDLASHMSQNGADTVISYDANDSVTVKNTTMSSITARNTSFFGSGASQS